MFFSGRSLVLAGNFLSLVVVELSISLLYSHVKQFYPYRLLKMRLPYYTVNEKLQVYKCNCWYSVISFSHFSTPVSFFDFTVQGFPQAISDGGSEFIFLTPHLFPLMGGQMGGQPKISQKSSSARKRTQNLWASSENPDPFWFFIMLFSFFFTFLLIFYVNFPQFFMDISIFSWGVRPPWPPTFFQMGGQKFFSWGVRKSKWGVI